MAKHPILDMPLSSVLKMEFALPLQQMLNLYTVGSFLSAWRNPKNHHYIEQVFETPEQARHAAAVCAAFMGISSTNVPADVQQWWAN